MLWGCLKGANNIFFQDVGTYFQVVKFLPQQFICPLLLPTFFCCAQVTVSTSKTQSMELWTRVGYWLCSADLLPEMKHIPEIFAWWGSQSTAPCGNESDVASILLRLTEQRDHYSTVKTEGLKTPTIVMKYCDRNRSNTITVVLKCVCDICFQVTKAAFTQYKTVSIMETATEQWTSLSPVMSSQGNPTALILWDRMAITYSMHL